MKLNENISKQFLKGDCKDPYQRVCQKDFGQITFKNRDERSRIYRQLEEANRETLYWNLSRIIKS
jgi:uncharacterized protein YjaZ